LLKKIAGKIFGFEREIAELQKRIRELSWDTSFDMWTRAAFLNFCDIMPRSLRVLVFIDMDRIAFLNKELGYEEVNRRVRDTFSVPFRRSDIVARWYSGDEIVILFDADLDAAQHKANELEASAAAQDLSFTYNIGEWDVGNEEVEDAIERLANEVLKKKKNSHHRQATDDAL